MAKLTAYGRTEIGTLYTTGAAIRYMSDRKILRNIGLGWKLWKTVKETVSPEQAFQNAKAKQEKVLIEFPAYAAYRAALHQQVKGLHNRNMLNTIISLMPNDYDGVWSEACDTYGGPRLELDLNDIVKLCSLYQLAIKEKAAKINLQA
jgi:hypothetical protein